VKKVLMLSLLCIVIGSAAVAQVDLSQVMTMDPQSPEFAQLAQAMMDEVDLSDVEFYFAGPVDLLVRNVEFQGMRYAAVLSYDGQGTFEIQIPGSTDPTGLPMSLDLSEVDVAIDLEKIRVSNIIADGYYFSGDLVAADAITQLAVQAAYIGRPVPSVDVDAYEAEIADLEEEIDDLEGRVASLQAENADLEDDLAEARADDTDQVANLREELAAAEAEIEEKEARIVTLENRIARLGDADEDGAGPVARAQSARTVMPDPELASPAGGSWSLTDRGLTQSNAQALFGKYVGSYSPQGAELVYGISGRANGEGWRGFGLHFQASGSENQDRYGFGESYLVWVTRDPLNLGTDQTFIQLYKSFDDVRMIQLASRAIDDDIADGVDVSVLVERRAGSIYVINDGEVALQYTDDAFYSNATQVAVRALGNVTITGVELPR
jgi:cell division protein FtsB